MPFLVSIFQTKREEGNDLNPAPLFLFTTLFTFQHLTSAA